MPLSLRKTCMSRSIDVLLYDGKTRLNPTSFRVRTHVSVWLLQRFGCTTDRAPDFTGFASITLITEFGRTGNTTVSAEVQIPTGSVDTAVSDYVTYFTTEG